VTDLVRLVEHYGIVAESDRPEAPLRVLKHGGAFAVFDQHGDIIPEAGQQGLYHHDTRFLSGFELRLGRQRPLLLSSSVTDDNTVFTVDLTNPDITRDGEVIVMRGQIHVFRSLVLCDGCCYQRIRISNHALHPIQVPLSLRFESDFADLFEVRGTPRPARGKRLPPSAVESALVLVYQGLDGVQRRTRVQSDRAPDAIKDDRALFLIELPPNATTTVDTRVTCEIERVVRPREPAGYDEAVAVTTAEVVAWRAGSARITSSSESLNRWMARSEADLQMMVTETAYGPYPYAGVPWFSTPFGRDGIITALERLWIDPGLARGVLSFLAATQATEASDAQDAQPGKILHEMRGGEMAALGEVPFARYYGSIDATSLFLMLADAYYTRTADLAFLDRLWPHVLAAVDWMAGYGDIDRDGFLEYARRSSKGLIHQGWKDSHDSIFHEDGTLAEPPIAVCEVQGYAYAAWQGVARLAEARGDGEQASRWHDRAEALRERFETSFWCEDLGTYALALDGLKRPCRVRSSNAGHCLMTGIASPAHANRVAAAVTADTSFAGWGIRTIDARELRYNPMSYHNGSIWPHDNALVAAGLARYGHLDGAARVFTAMFDLSRDVDLHRLPELICGFHRRSAQRPTLYPVACAPQSWAAAAVFFLLQSCLGVEIDAVRRRVTLGRAVLPESIEWVRVSQLRVADAAVDLRFERHGQEVSVEIEGRRGDVEVHVTG
jgi:glycogen debranching enzyme